MDRLVTINPGIRELASIPMHTQSLPEDIIKWLEGGEYELVQIDENREFYDKVSHVKLSLVRKYRKPDYRNKPYLTP